MHLRPRAPFRTSLLGLMGTAALGSSLIFASAASAEPATTTPADAAGCLSLSDGSFTHDFDPTALTLTVEFVPTDPYQAGATLCDGGQPFTVASWAVETPEATVPQLLLDAAEAVVSIAGPDGRQVITAPDTGECAVQVDGYMTAAGDVPDVLTGFGHKPDSNEPPLVGGPHAPYTSTGNRPYTVVKGEICTAPPVVVATSECVVEEATSTLAVTNPNPWAVSYRVLTAAGRELADSDTSTPFDLAPGETKSIAVKGVSGTLVLSVEDINGSYTEVPIDIVECLTDTPPVPGTEVPTPPSDVDVPTPDAPAPPVVVPAVVPPVEVPPTVDTPEIEAPAPTTTTAPVDVRPVASQQPLAFTGAPVLGVLFGGLGLLVVGGGLAFFGKRRR